MTIAKPPSFLEAIGGSVIWSLLPNTIKRNTDTGNQCPEWAPGEGTIYS